MTSIKRSYNYFIGIDIGKAYIDVAIADHKNLYQYQNSLKGWEKFYKNHKPILSKALVVVEATGGYEQGILVHLTERKVPVHRASANKIKYFIRSFGTYAKSDRIDAKHIALYAKERHASLSPVVPADERLSLLRTLVSCRENIVQTTVQYKNRRQAPLVTPGSIDSFNNILKTLKKELKVIEKEIDNLLKSSKELQHRCDILCSEKGIGATTAVKLMALLPELGTIDKKRIASLAGLAPHPYESGNSTGYRKVRGGRSNIKPVLAIATMSLTRSKSILGVFYRKLCKNGKKKMVALTAVMRRLIVRLNAKMRDAFYPNPVTAC